MEQYQQKHHYAGFSILVEYMWLLVCMWRFKSKLLRRWWKEGEERGGTEGPLEIEASKERDRRDMGLTASDVVSMRLGLR
ncbi:unnamed protein product [Lactuca virosa]|uniref:Uncharacterized protein n=1 Tax=Lactuca virosa TaxID=75947 RepID=A0AAU9NDF1_9ASTR|nr:unnamed protein product [Lactuca virosa]